MVPDPRYSAGPPTMNEAPGRSVTTLTTVSPCSGGLGASGCCSWSSCSIAGEISGSFGGSGPRSLTFASGGAAFLPSPTLPSVADGPGRCRGGAAIVSRGGPTSRTRRMTMSRSFFCSSCVHW